MQHAARDTGETVFSCLVVDDSDFARINMKKIVADVGGQVLGEAKNGEEALALYGRLRPDLVLLDITMPVLDGLETLSRILEQDSSARVIIVSSLGNKDMIKKALFIGARQFVTKPFNPVHVSMIIRSVVGREE